MKSLREEFLEHYGEYRILVKVPITNPKHLAHMKAFSKSKGIKFNGVKFISIWKRIDIAPLPERGDFDLKSVNESKYFFH